MTVVIILFGVTKKEKPFDNLPENCNARVFWNKIHCHKVFLEGKQKLRFKFDFYAGESKVFQYFVNLWPNSTVPLFC